MSSKVSLQSRGKRPKKIKKQSSSKISQDVVPSTGKLESTASSSSDVFASRRILQPGEKWDYRVVFQSASIGDYNYSFRIEIANAKTIYYVECIGKCDIPQINTDPEIIYPKIIAARNQKNAYDSCVYVQDTDVFDFGFIFLQKVDDKYV